MPDIPITVWEQIQVVIVFAFLLAGMAWLMIKAFSKAVADINSHYAAIVEKTNAQWQQYFDARSETSKLLNSEIIAKLKELTEAIQFLSSSHDAHDTMVRTSLDAMAEKRQLLSKQKRSK